eukprot:COSAG06_NODE_8063_length_2284_cov_55.770252_3_plen_170_part_00
MAAAIRSHFEFWNIIDLLVAMLSMASLVLMAVATHSDASVDINLLRCFQATAGLLGGIKLLSFLRGLDFSAFLISMLEAIVADMVNFFAVLLVIMVSCVCCLVPHRPHVSLHHLNLHVCVHIVPVRAGLHMRSFCCSRTLHWATRPPPTPLRRRYESPSLRCCCVDWAF